MIPIRVQCFCGQRYTFEVEPVNGRMSSPVACPVCGADGTAAANAAIAQSMAAPPVASPPPQARAASLRAPAPAPAVRLAAPVAAAPAPAPGKPALLPGQLDRTQAEHEARAKVLWGDPPHEVTKFLMRQGIAYEEASELVDELFRERAATIRANGIRKIVTGSGLMFVPIIAWMIFAGIGVISLKLFAIAIMVGLWGAWQVFKGIFMVSAPKSESGDVAEQ